jgi:acyl transferase domain-containing protein
MCTKSSPIAIIGMSGRFAGSANLEAFWSHLQAGESCIEEIRREGWETSTNAADPEHVDTSFSQWGGMLADIDQFDPLFFNISPLEAARMDPQQRLILEEAYKSFEDAGYSAEQLSDKKVGVFVGARSSDYKEQALLRRDSANLLSEVDSHLFLGNDMAILAARISYVFKILLAMKYQQIPPSINVEEANPQIDFQNSPFFINTDLPCEWESSDGSPRRAGVSSFGLSGTNCHLILEEAPLNKQTAHEQARPYFFFPFSAKTKAALSQKVGDLLTWLEKEGEQYAVEDISYTLVQGRSHFAV